MGYLKETRDTTDVFHHDIRSKLYEHIFYRPGTLLHIYTTVAEIQT